MVGPSPAVQSSSSTVSTASPITVPDPCLDAFFATSGGDRHAQPTAASGACPYACPAPIPDAVTTGLLAITPAPKDPNEDLSRRAIAGRIAVEKRASPESVKTVNGCRLQTPKGFPVTIPAYDDGEMFLREDLAGTLAPNLRQISRYYKTVTPADAAATGTIVAMDRNVHDCAPTIVAVAAVEAASNAVPGIQGQSNGKFTVDHACRLDLG